MTVVLGAVWVYETQTTPPPGEGGVRTDDVATMWLHRQDTDGFDRSIEFALASPPFDVLIRDSDGHSRRWKVTEMVDSDEYLTLTLEYVSGSVEPVAKNADVLLEWLTAEPEPEPEPGPELPDPTAEQEQRLAQAVIQKAARFYLMGEAPLGTYGEVSEFGQPSVRPDYLVKETLYGLHHTVEVDAASLAALVTVEDVIRVGLGTDPSGFPTDRLPDVERALAGAVDWVDTNLTRSWGIG